MNFSEIELPSNRRFGFFFSFVFGLASVYFYMNSSMALVYFAALLSAIFLVLTVLKAEALLPLNKMWMRFGFLLGMIVSPIVLGLIFFCLFTPIALAMRLSGRDELRLKIKNKSSYWIERSERIQSDSFKKQF